LTPDRWRQIEELYHRALERPSDVRAGFLAEVCGGDEELKRRLELLLAEDASADKRLDQPAAKLLPEVLTGDSVASLSVGARLGPYRIEGILGRGGMGQVYKAHDSRLGRWVAIKVSTDQFGRRFEQEARAVAALNHPNVCTLHDIGPDYLVMEYIEGTPLKGPLPLDQALSYAAQICDALDAAHKRNITHRDLKPANILVTPGGDVKLLDFGLATLSASHEAVSDSNTRAATDPGTTVGTVGYMSPEQARGEPLDGRSDLFSLGCVLYEMATGVSPFRTDSLMATMRRLVDGAPQAMGSLNPELPPWFIYIVTRLLEKDPSRRVGSAKEVSELLEGCLAHVQQPAAVPLPVSLVPLSNISRFFSISRRSLGVIAMFATLGLGLLGMVLWQASEAPDIAGKWTGEEWGAVVLEAEQPGVEKDGGRETDPRYGKKDQVR
jgi:serine/threonine protein kinase